MLADSWAPVIDSTDPGSYDGPSRRNPYVVGSGSEAEAQVVYRVGEGWLVFIENFRGDLGDVTGEEVGSVDGKPATLFSVNGGELVQWSYNGLLVRGFWTGGQQGCYTGGRPGDGSRAVRSSREIEEISY